MSAVARISNPGPSSNSPARFASATIRRQVQRGPLRVRAHHLAGAIQIARRPSAIANRSARLRQDHDLCWRSKKWVQLLRRADGVHGQCATRKELCKLCKPDRRKAPLLSCNDRDGALAQAVKISRDARRNCAARKPGVLIGERVRYRDSRGARIVFAALEFARRAHDCRESWRICIKFRETFGSGDICRIEGRVAGHFVWRETIELHQRSSMGPFIITAGGHEKTFEHLRNFGACIVCSFAVVVSKTI